MFALKEYRRALYDALNDLPWKDFQLPTRTPKGIGRIRRRTIPVLLIPDDLPLPNVRQVWLVKRYVTYTASRYLSAVAEFGVASHTIDPPVPPTSPATFKDTWPVKPTLGSVSPATGLGCSTVRTRSGFRIGLT